MEILATLFGSKERVRVMRYCIVHMNENFDIQTASADLQLDTITIRRELKLMAKIGFIKEVSYSKQITKIKKGKTEIHKEKTLGYKVDQTFVYLASFKSLLLEKEELSPLKIYEQFKKLAKLDVFLLSGVFLGAKTENGIDLLIVGRNLKKSKIEEQICQVEGFMGTELTYAVFETDEFAYRHMMHDKFVRHILQSPSEIVLNNLNLK